MEKDTRTANDEDREEVQLSWRSPARVFKTRSREYYNNIGAIVFLLIVIFVFAKEFALIFAVLSVVFFLYAIYTVPPETVNHRITNLGVESAGHFYRWEMLHEFWFDEQWGQSILVLRPYIGARILILLRDVDKEAVRTLLAKYIPYREVPDKTWIDNAANWLSRKIPLEKTSS